MSGGNLSYYQIDLSLCDIKYEKYVCLPLMDDFLMLLGEELLYESLCSSVGHTFGKCKDGIKKNKDESSIGAG